MEPGILAAGCTQRAVGCTCFHSTHAYGTDGVGGAVKHLPVSNRHHLFRTVVLTVGAETRSGQRLLLVFLVSNKNSARKGVHGGVLIVNARHGHLTSQEKSRSNYTYVSRSYVNKM